MIFKDRVAAGQRLAEELKAYANCSDVIVLGLPRGGIPVAYEVARALNVPLDVFLVRKLGVPGQEELAMGAIASGGVRVLNRSVLRTRQLFDAVVHKVTVREQRELERREQVYRGDRPTPNLRNRTVLLVDDGLATGATMRAAVTALKLHHPARIVVAVPVASPETCDRFKAEVDDIICAETPSPFSGVGQWYNDFSQTSDAEVQDLLKRASDRQTIVT